MSGYPTDKELFADAIERPSGERDQFLREACQGNPELLEEVRQLLTVHGRAGSFMSRPVLTADPPRAFTPAPEGPGTVIGRYKILQAIGEGGFGTVFMAEQERPVRRRVALKVIKLGMDTAQVIARFEAERQALAIMDHPNIAKVLDAGATESGRPFFVMELVKGDPITAYCDKHTLTVWQRLDLVTQVCQAVQHAHTKGVIHRDLKPSNILVSTQDGRALVRVIDFGIAKATDHRLTERTVFTEFHQLIGTPEYMSPEQAEGSLDIDTRTDVYSLGVLLYELLTGATPFDAKRLRSAAYGELQRIIREIEPPKPSTRLSQAADARASVAALRRVEPGQLDSIIRGELDWIVMKALDKDRARRYDSPAALSADLQRFLAGQAVSAAPPGAAYQLRKFVRRHRGPVLASGLIAAVLLAGIAGTAIGLYRERVAHAEALAQARRAERAASDAAKAAQRADREARDARASARIADAVNRLMNSTVQRANRAREGGRADVTVREVMDAAAQNLASGPAQEPGVESALARTIGQTYLELSLLEPAERLLRIAAERAAKAYGADSVEHAEALNDLGAALKARGDLPGAAAQYATASQIFSAAGDKSAKDLAALRINLGAMLAAGGKLEDAEHELQQSVAYYESLPAPRPEQYTIALHDLANVAFQRDDPERAKSLLLRVIDIERSTYGPDDPRTLESLHGLSIVQFATGDPGAEATLRQELATARRLYGDNHAEVATLLHSLGSIQLRSGDLAGAEQSYRESADVARHVYGADNRETAAQQAALATALFAEGKFDETVSVLRQSLPILIKADEAGTGQEPGVWQPETMYAAYQLGTSLERQNRPADAEPVARQGADAAAKAVKEGDKYEWMRLALDSLRGGILLLQAADETQPRDARLATLTRAESLVLPATQRLLTMSGKLGVRSRKMVIGETLDRMVRLCTALNALDPTPERAAALKEWQSRRDAFDADASPR